MIYIISYSGHRIDELLADLARNALESINLTCSRDIPIALNDDDSLLVFNGLYIEGRTQQRHIDRLLKHPNAFYVIDDHTVHVPKASNYITQFTNIHPIDSIRDILVANKFTIWQVSKLGLLLDTIFDKPIKSKVFHEVYWGHRKPERDKYYRDILDEDTTLVIGDKKEWDDLLLNVEYAPYERDMQKLYNIIAKGTTTLICGDDFHNKVNRPFRYYEALFCEVKPIVHEDLLNEDYPFDTTSSITDIGQELTSILGIHHLAKKDDVSKPDTTIEHTTTCVDDVVAKRGTIYGNYTEGMKCRANILRALNAKHMETHAGEPLSEELRIMFGEIALKMMRIASDPTHVDSYIDLAGYAKLMKESVVDGK